MKRSALTSMLAACALTLGLAACSDEAETPVSDGSAAQETSTPAPASGAANGQPAGTSVDVGELMAPGPLPDIVQGQADAPVTIVEYASLTCPHCATFHTQTYPTLKQDYIDTGKVRYIFREFPLDNYATAGFMLARCSDQANYYPIIEAFFAQQRAFLDAADPFEWLQGFGKQVGFTQETLDACLSNQQLLENVMDVRHRASEKYGVSSTPSFFINGKIKRGTLSVEELAKEVDAASAS